MASLPPGWEPDYDGSRWLYRYTPTGFIQYTFPKPGDEFPEFVAPGAGPIPLAPEERLASEKQIKFRKKGIVDAQENSNDFERDGKKDGSFVSMSATGYFDPSEFMYYGGDDDGELTPIAGKDDNQPKYPLGFVAELASSDTILCAEDLAPVELDAGSYELTTTVSPAQKLDDHLVIEPLPHFTELPVALKSSDEDDIYSADTPIQSQPTLRSAARPSVVGDVQHQVVEPSAGPVNDRKSEFSRKQISPESITQSGPNLSVEIEKPMDFSESRKAKNATPLVSISSSFHSTQKPPGPGKSVDDIRAMPNSLQAHQPPTNRLRFKSATHEPWRPSIKFVQTGLMQESRVSTPALSGSFALQQQIKDLNSVEDTRMSSWLVEQAIAVPPSVANDEAGSLSPTSLGKVQTEVLDSAQPRGHDHQRKLPDLKTSGVATKIVTQNSLLPPLPLARKTPKEGLAGQGDRVVETIIDVPAMEQVATNRGVQLVDASPGLSRSSITRRGAVKKRFSWESEADDPSDKMGDQSTTSGDPTPSTLMESLHRTASSIPQENDGDGGAVEVPPPGHITNSKEGIPQSVASPGRHQEQVVHQLSPRASALSSPRLPFEASPPTHGQITANKVVVVNPREDRKASIATFEEGLRKPLPPLPLAPRSQALLTKTTVDQPRSNASEQMSELIAVANAAMPSARPRSAVPPGPSAESVWRNMRTQASRPALSPNLTAAPSSTPSIITLELPSRTAGRARSNSQLAGPSPGLRPPGRHHSRSQSLMSTSDFSPRYLQPSSDSVGLPQAPAAGNTAWPALRVIPAPSDGHKSHKRLSVHTTPAGVFQYHPLRSSPVFAPTSDAPETQEPHPVDYIKAQTSLHPQLESKGDVISKAQRAERPRLQVKPPFVGLPSSPRPVPKPRQEPDREAKADLGVDDSSKKPVTNERITTEETSPVIQRRQSAQSQVSSPTSSIFSSLRDSSVSATSSMADADATSLSELGADMDKSLVKCVEPSQPTSRHEEGTGEQMSNRAAETHTVPSYVSLAPSGIAQAQRPPTERASIMSVQRPPNVPDALRPAGTRASLWDSPKIEDDPTDQPLIPTVIVRAPTVKLRHWERQITREEQPPIPHSPNLPLASPKLDVQNISEPIGSPTQLMVSSVQSNDEVEKPIASPTRAQGFMQSLRKSWQFTTSNAPRLSLFAGPSHTRSRSQSALPEPHGKVSGAIAMVAQQAVMPWQWSGRDNWSSRDSLPVDTGSISNVEATIRFFNSTFQARRSDPESVAQPEPQMPRPPLKDASTIVVRKVGPPVVVRLPC